jgi:hypothetical protein
MIFIIYWVRAVFLDFSEEAVADMRLKGFSIWMNSSPEPDSLGLQLSFRVWVNAGGQFLVWNLPSCGVDQLTDCDQGIYPTVIITLVELQKSVCNDIIDSFQSEDLRVAEGEYDAAIEG